MTLPRLRDRRLGLRAGARPARGPRHRRARLVTGQVVGRATGRPGTGRLAGRGQRKGGPDANAGQGPTQDLGRIAAAMDARAGTKAVRSKFRNSWNDVKLAFDWWAKRTDKRFTARVPLPYCTCCGRGSRAL